MPFWIAAVVMSRDVILVVGALSSTWWAAASILDRPGSGKVATVLPDGDRVARSHLSIFQDCRSVSEVSLWLAAAFTVVSGLQYLVQGMRYLSERPPTSGIPRSHETAVFR